MLFKSGIVLFPNSYYRSSIWLLKPANPTAKVHASGLFSFRFYMYESVSTADDGSALASGSRSSFPNEVLVENGLFLSLEGGLFTPEWLDFT